MKLLLPLTIGLSLLASNSHAQDKVFRASLVAAVAAHGADLASTENCLGAGSCHETNPFLLRFKNPVAFGAVKMGTAGLALWVTAKVHDAHHERIAILMNLITTVGLSYVAGHNARVANEPRR